MLHAGLDLSRRKVDVCLGSRRLALCDVAELVRSPPWVGGNLRRRCGGGCGWRTEWLGVASSVIQVSRTSGGGMASTATAPPPAVHREGWNGSDESPAARPVSARRHFAWLVGGMAGSFLVPFIVADQLGLQRDSTTRCT